MAAPKNPIGAKSDKLWRDAVMRAVRRRENGKGPQALERMADKVVEQALEGNMAAIKEIGDRLDGRAATSASVAAVVSDAPQDAGQVDRLEVARRLAWLLNEGLEEVEEAEKKH